MDEIMKQLYNQNYKFEPNKCPPEITVEMLRQQMKTRDNNFKENGKEYLWTLYYDIMFPPNIFGITADLTDKKTPLFIFEQVNEKPQLAKIFITEKNI